MMWAVLRQDTGHPRPDDIKLPFGARVDKHEISPRAQSGEVHLTEMLCSLWTAKWLILGVTAVVTCISVAYALMATPAYEATTRTLPPTARGLVSYNAASQLTGDAISGMLDTRSSSGIAILSPNQAYAAFIMQLRSEEVKEKFFETYYLPMMSKENKASTQQLWKRLEKSVDITLPTTSDSSATVTIYGTDPDRISDWANRYVELTIDSTKSILLDNLKGEIEIRNNGLKKQIATLRAVANKERRSDIVRLQNALHIAESIGLESPQEGMSLISIGNDKGNYDSFVNSDLAYLRGVKALRSEIEQIKKRQDNDAYINELPGLLKRQALLNGIDIDPQSITVARIDSVAKVPEAPIRPRKRLIVGLGLIVGLMLGAAFALANLMLKKA